MCLTINKNNLKPIAAEQDIVCYKVLRKQLYNGALLAPIYSFEYDFDVIYGTHEEYFEHASICDDGRVLAEYGFHSFSSLSDAVRMKERLLDITLNCFEFVVVKCTIPNGARFYIGKQTFSWNEDNSPDGYCSEAIRIDEIVNENKE